MKNPILLLAALAAIVVPASAADKAQVASHFKSYHTAAKAVVAQAIANKVDAAEVEKLVDVMVADARWLAAEYAKAHPEGAKLLKTVDDNIPAIRKLSFHEIETQWHDLGYFSEPGHDVGLDLKAEENEHFTDPIHAILHPFMVLKAAQDYVANHKEADLKAVKAEMEEGLEQAEKVAEVLSK